MRALIVTDNPLSASAIHRAMRDVSIRAVISGYVNASRPCTGTVAQIEPDVVIVDETGTPDNAIARIAEIRAALVDVKIVLLTASMDEQWLGKATAAGIDAAIRKTPQAVSLGALVREVMAGNVYHAFAQPQAKAEPAQATGLTTARARDPPPRRRRRLEQHDRRPALDHRADGQVPPLQRLPQARRGQPDPGQPLRVPQRAHRARDLQRHARLRGGLNGTDAQH